MGKKKNAAVRVHKNGCFIEIKIREQYSHSHKDVIFAGKARIDSPGEVRDLFRAACARGLDVKPEDLLW